jgi:xanthine phosphoribosyltransferase
MHREATDLAVRLRVRGPFRGIVAIARGGLVPAAIIARVLGVRLIETLCMASYDVEVKRPLSVLKTAPSEVGDGAHWLLVDDVADSGSTTEAARRMLPLAHYATLYVKPAGRSSTASSMKWRRTSGSISPGTGRLPRSADPAVTTRCSRLSAFHPAGLARCRAGRLLVRRHRSATKAATRSCASGNQCMLRRWQRQRQVVDKHLRQQHRPVRKAVWAAV